VITKEFDEIGHTGGAVTFRGSPSMQSPRELLSHFRLVELALHGHNRGWERRNSKVTAASNCASFRVAILAMADKSLTSFNVKRQERCLTVESTPLLNPARIGNSLRVRSGAADLKNMVRKIRFAIPQEALYVILFIVRNTGQITLAEVRRQVS
jgi:hypothetical protein